MMVMKKVVEIILIFKYLPVVTGVSDKIILSPGYSKDTVPPTDDDQPLLLQATAQLENILDVREDKQEIRYQSLAHEVVEQMFIAWR